jgi:hypothetical protein
VGVSIVWSPSTHKRRFTTLVIALALVGVSCNPPDGSERESVAPPATTTTNTTVAVLETTVTETVTSTSVITTTSATVASTSIPPQTTSTYTLPSIATLDTGLFCRDLRALGYTYVDAVDYWIVELRPDRMDADRNGIPCETVWPSADVITFWGDPLPATTTPHTRYRVDHPTYYPESLTVSDEYFGSGCSPGSAALPDGVWFGFIEAAAATSVDFDLMCFAPTPEGEDGAGRVTNASSRLRSVPVARTAEVFAIAPDGYWMLMPYIDWYSDPGREGFCPPDGCWHVWLYVNDGHVTEVVQIWFA